MNAVTAKKHRIVHIAKELNVSHRDIMDLLEKNGIEVHSHMSPVDEQTYQLIVDEFDKDRQTVERYRKEQIRKEIRSRKLEESLQTPRTLEIMMPDEQRRLEEEEQKAREEEKQAREAQEKLEAQTEQEEAAPEVGAEVLGAGRGDEDEKVPAETEGQKKPKKLKLRKIDLSEIESQITSRRAKPGRKKPEEEEEKPEKVSVDTTIKKTLAAIDTKHKRKRYKRARPEETEETEEDIEKVKVREFMSVQELAGVLDVEPSDIITKCLGLGMPATMNQRLDMDTITLLVEDAGFRVDRVEETADDLFSLEDGDEDVEKTVPRAPVVTIMGHVDHGKTSLLDYIRNTNVVAGEAGAITQQIGAYEVELDGGRRVTFLDTPGHEAFTSMRARGAQVTDVVILIVAADDGVKPQTLEAIDHAKAAGVPIVVAINKIDKKSANPDRVKKDLSEHGILVEEWGGNYQSIEISAKTGHGVNELLELLALETEVLELKANPDTEAKGTVIESRLDRGHGAIGTVLIQKGTVRAGDAFVCGNSSGKVRALLNERNVRIESAGPSQPVQILGFQVPPQAGDRFAVVAGERQAKQLAGERERVRREIDRQRIRAKTLDRISEEIREGVLKTLALVVKADADGSIEALVDALREMPGEELKIDVVRKGVGNISESDILLASASGAIVIGFNVGIHPNAKLLAKHNQVDIRVYDVIYDAIEEIKRALEGLLEPEVIESVLGRAEVKEVFRISRIGPVAGCVVTDGIISLNDRARVMDNGEMIYEGSVTSLKHFQEDVKSIEEGKECGIGIEGMKNFQVGHVIEAFKVDEVKRTLD
ncbi:MAG: translation initiation factor IF-2 [Fidelibacterota bacterium]